MKRASDYLTSLIYSHHITITHTVRWSFLLRAIVITTHSLSGLLQTVYAHLMYIIHPMGIVLRRWILRLHLHRPVGPGVEAVVRVEGTHLSRRGDCIGV